MFNNAKEQYTGLIKKEKSSEQKATEDPQNVPMNTIKHDATDEEYLDFYGKQKQIE
jgi:hypothetical protein